MKGGKLIWTWTEKGTNQSDAWHFTGRSPGAMVFGFYFAEPQVMTNIAMENHQFLLGKLTVYQWPSSITMLNYQRGNNIYIFTYIYVWIYSHSNRK